MIAGRKIVVVLPAYNAEQTVERSYREIPFDIVDEIILVDDASGDRTADTARGLGIRHVLVHPRNRGYGGNQKTCYEMALSLGADIVIMLHPDYQYTPKLITAMASIIAYDVYPVVFGSRILGRGALTGGMPRYKYIANRGLTAVQNLLLGQKLSEYHTGYRAYAREVLETIPFQRNSDDFVFDNQVVAQIFACGFNIAEVTCPTKYFPEASSIGLRRSITYGLGVLGVSWRGWMHRCGLRRWDLLTPRQAQPRQRA